MYSDQNVCLGDFILSAHRWTKVLVWLGSAVQGNPGLLIVIFSEMLSQVMSVINGIYLGPL